jgi:hypothetical protein
MYLGTAPLLTDGPGANYFGGSPILPNLSKEAPWPGVNLLYVLSGLLWLAMFLVKRVLTARPASYIQSLSNAMVEDRFNIYSGTTILG